MMLLADGDVEYIAKLSTSTDPYPVVKAEAVGLDLAHQVGITVPNSAVIRSLDRDVLLVKRFDRPGAGRRRMLISGLTLLGFGDFLGARYPSYTVSTSNWPRPTTSAHSCARAPRTTRPWTSVASTTVPAGSALPSRLLRTAA